MKPNWGMGAYFFRMEDSPALALLVCSLCLEATFDHRRGACQARLGNDKHGHSPMPAPSTPAPD